MDFDPFRHLRLERNDVRASRTLRLVDVAELLGVTK
jgi:hypothetical protein